MASLPFHVPSDAQLSAMADEDLVRLRVVLERELRRRGVPYSVGELGEKLVIDHYRSTPNLPKLQCAPRGTKNVDALSRDGERFSIKTVWNAKKTGTVYPDADNPDKQLFEYLIIARLDEDLSLRSIHQLAWDQFLKVRLWDRRMSAWYVGISNATFKVGKAILEPPPVASGA